MTNTSNMVNLLSFPSILWLICGSSEATGIDNIHHLQDDLVCPFNEERLYYNIDIYIEGLAGG